MERLKASLGKLRVANDVVYDKVALAKEYASDLKVAALHVKVPTVPTRFMQGRQYSIGSRTVVEDKQISEGGFAFVWLAKEASTNKELVLKKILCQDKASLTMAQREIQLLERLPIHPNLVRYFGSTTLGTESKKTKEVALLFEFCSGGHLLNLLEKHQGLLLEKQIVDTLKEVVAGVAVLHEISPPVQHRDLKVENVLLGADGHWKLLDFGSWSDEHVEPGKLDKPSLSALQEQIERYTTMMYRPPEMVDFYLEFAISEKVDIWMIGCILYTLMFYRHPFQDESTLAIANARYQLPSSPKYSDKIQDLIHWLLARDPSDRPSAHELLCVLQNLEDDSPLQLPKAVVERRDAFERLFGDAPSSKAAGQQPESSSHEPTSSEKKSKHRHHGKDGKERKTAKRKEQNDDPWGQAASSQAWPTAAPPGGREAMPPAAFSAPEPSRFGWADFGSECCGSSQTVPSQDGHELQLQQPNSSATTSLLRQNSPPGKTSPRQRPKALSPQVADPWAGLPYANMPSTGSRSPSSHRSGAGRSTPQGKQDAGSFWSLAPEAQDAGQAAPPRPRKQLEAPEVEKPRRAHRRVASGTSGSTWPMFPDASPTARSSSLPPESQTAADTSPSGKTRISSVTEGSPHHILERRSPPSITIQGPPVQPPTSWASWPPQSGSALEAKSPASSSRAEVSPEQSPSVSPRPRGSGASKASAAAAAAAVWPGAASQQFTRAWLPVATSPGVAWPGAAKQAVPEVPSSTVSAGSPVARQTWPAEVTSTPGGEEDPWKAVMSAGPSPAPSPKADGFDGFGQGGKPTWNAFE